MAKPTTLPRWATGGGAAVTTPAETKKDTGWTAGEKPPAQYLNWLGKWIYNWCAYLDGLTAEALTWTAAQTFAAAVSFTNTLSFSGTTLTIAPTGAVTYSPAQAATLSALPTEDVPYVQQSTAPTSRRALGKFRAGAAASSWVRLYIGTYSGNPYLEIAVNASWNATSAKWVADSVGTQMVVWRMGLDGLHVHRGTDPGGGTPGLTDATLDDLATDLVVDSDNRLIASAPKLHVVGAGGEPAYANSWTNIAGGTTYETYFYRSLDGHIHLELATDQANGVGKSGTTIFTLPAGFRPNKLMQFFTHSWEKSGAAGHVQAVIVNVDTTGTVQAFFDDTNGGTVLILGHFSFLPTQP